MITLKQGGKVKPSACTGVPLFHSFRSAGLSSAQLYIYLCCILAQDTLLSQCLPRIKLKAPNISEDHLKDMHTVCF